MSALPVPPVAEWPFSSSETGPCRTAAAGPVAPTLPCRVSPSFIVNPTESALPIAALPTLITPWGVEGDDPEALEDPPQPAASTSATAPRASARRRFIDILSAGLDALGR